MRTITKKQVVRGLRKLARENPDKVAACVYGTTEQPICIIGCFLAAEGADINVLEGTVNHRHTRGRLYLQGFRFTPSAATIAARVQYAQDEGETWRRAVDQYTTSSM